MVGTMWMGSPAVGSGGVAQSIDGGATFQALSVAYVPLTLTALSCPTASACVAVGGDSPARITLVRRPSTARAPRAPRGLKPFVTR